MRLYSDIGQLKIAALIIFVIVFAIAAYALNEFSKKRYSYGFFSLDNLLSASGGLILAFFSIVLISNGWAIRDLISLGAVLILSGLTLSAFLYLFIKNIRATDIIVGFIGTVMEIIVALAVIVIIVFVVFLLSSGSSKNKRR